MSIFLHTDYASHDPETNSPFHSYLTKTIPAGTRIVVKFSESRGYQRAPVSGILGYKVWINEGIYPFIIHDDGTWEAIMQSDQVEELPNDANQSEDSPGNQGEAQS